MGDDSRGQGSRRFVVVGGLLLIGVAVQTAQGQWSRDMWQHIATVREFADHLGSPRNPIDGSATDSVLLTPYFWILGAVTRTSGLDAVTVLSAAAIGNVTLVLVGLRRFIRALGGSDRVAAMALAFTLTVWGVGPWRWSGYLSLNSIGFGAAYPSMFATGLGLVLVAMVVDVVRAGDGAPPRPARLGSIAALTTVVLLVHPFTGLWVGVLAAAQIVAPPRAALADRTRAALALAGVLGVVATLAWPFFTLMTEAGASGDLDDIHRLLFRSFAIRLCLATVALAALLGRLRDDRRDPLAVGGLVCLGIVVAGGATAHQSWARALPGALVAAHTALAFVVDAAWDRRSGARPGPRAARALTVALALVGITGSAAGLARMVPRPLVEATAGGDGRLAHMTRPFETLVPAMAGHQSFVATGGLIEPAWAAGGYPLVMPSSIGALSDPADRRARARDNATLLAGSAPADDVRAVLAARGITRLVAAPQDPILETYRRLGATDEVDDGILVVLDLTPVIAAEG